MKITFTFILTFVLSSTFAQQDMFWNNYSNFNPAMSGFQYQQHGALSYTDYFLNNRSKALSVNYNMRLAEKHGVGLNFSGFNSNKNALTLTGNYNYQFNLKNAGKLSAGLGAGLSRFRDNPGYQNPNNTASPEARNFIQLNLGVAHKWKGLTTGMSLLNRISTETETNPLRLAGFNAHAEYNFTVGELFQLTPRVIYSSTSGRSRINTDLTVTYKKQFSLGVMYDLRGDLGFHAGWDINQKFRLAYLYNSGFSNQHPTYFQNGRHQFTLGFQLR